MRARRRERDYERRVFAGALIIEQRLWEEWWARRDPAPPARTPGTRYDPPPPREPPPRAAHAPADGLRRPGAGERSPGRPGAGGGP
jgi:hypothetical protein